MMTRAGTAAPIKGAAMNWALPAKMIEDIAWVMVAGTPSCTASAPKIKPKGMTPKRMGSWARTPAKSSVRHGISGSVRAGWVVSIRYKKGEGHNEFVPLPLQNDANRKMSLFVTQGEGIRCLVFRGRARAACERLAVRCRLEFRGWRQSVQNSRRC